MVLLEAIPHALATHITENLSIPTIGIGAGPGTSGQVLVITDVLGTYAMESENGQGSPAPRFVRHFGHVGAEAKRAIEGYVSEVKGRTFPANGETYGMKREEWEGFLARTRSDDVVRRSVRTLGKVEANEETEETEDGV